MPGLQLMPLHWGQSTRRLEVSGVKPVGRVLTPAKRGEVKRTIGSGRLGRPSGRC